MTLLGFAEGYTHIMMNVKQEVILLRTSTNENAIVTTASNSNQANGILELTKGYWKLQYMHVSNANRLPLLRFLQ